MKQIIGNPAEKERFYPRQQIIDELYDQLETGNNILISAPRRVGKTSCLLYLVNNPVSEYYMLHVVTQSVTDGNLYFKLLLDAILDSDSIDRFGKFGTKAISFLKDFASRFKSFSFGDGSLDMSGDAAQVDYYKEFNKFLSGIQLEGKQIVLLVDEFPITIENIAKEQGKDKALLFLQQNRTIRQNKKLREKVKFIYTGSIGLFSIVKGMNASAEVNDLFEINIPALSRKEAVDFATLLLGEHKIKIRKEMLNYMLDKIEWLIPFHIQLMVKEIRDLRRVDSGTIDKAFIDKAFRQVIQNGNIYFDHYRGRLNRVFKNKELKFINEFLSTLSGEQQMREDDVTNCAAKHRVEGNLKNILETLVYDGYIVETSEGRVYRFYSPILKNWWKKNV